MHVRFRVVLEKRVKKYHVWDTASYNDSRQLFTFVTNFWVNYSFVVQKRGRSFCSYDAVSQINNSGKCVLFRMQMWIFIVYFLYYQITTSYYVISHLCLFSDNDIHLITMIPLSTSVKNSTLPLKINCPVFKYTN